MKPPRFSYEAPTSLQDVLRILAERGDGARVLAGGQSLVPAMNLRLADPGHLVDLSRVPQLRGIDLLPDGAIRIGAMSRHAEVERSTLVREHVPLVPEVMRSVAHAAIRERGTVGGSLAHADPAAEWAAVCNILQASVVLASAHGGIRRMPASEFTQGVYTTALMPGELIVAVELPQWPEERTWAFEEVSRRRGDFAIVGALCTIDRRLDGSCDAARCVVFGLVDRPIALDTASLAGEMPSRAAIDGIAAAVHDMTKSPMHDHHASAAYRLELAETLVQRVLRRAAVLPQGQKP
jgi:aerobic carbon-monoxide dehydrogenase medium subunit